MSLPEFDNHDDRIRYYELILRRSLDDLPSHPLPQGYHFQFYRPGDRDAWIAIERSARELVSHEQGLEVWQRYYAAHEAELPERMLFLVEDATGEKIATATAFYDVINGDPSGDGWLHWVAVRRDCQGRGLSKPLIARALAQLKILGYENAKIPTQTTTWLACRIYLDFGFRPTPENALESETGWRILKRLTDHPALSHLSPATDGEVLARKKES